ncbi:MAG: hypothetical protein ACLP8S_10605 [Solirubrobacteraceae bacterium]
MDRRRCGRAPSEAPIVAVIGYETVGHKHLTDALARINAVDDARMKTQSPQAGASAP